MQARSKLPVALALVGALGFADPAPAVIIASGDGTGNTTAPVPDPGWSNVGTLGETTAVYIGGRFALTARHSGAGSISFGNATYTYVPGTAVQLGNGDGTYADLLMFQIHPEPPLPALSIASQSPPIGAPLIMVGNGRNRGPAISFDPNGPKPPDPVDGYEWGPAQSIRWGTNTVTDILLVGLIDATQTWTQTWAMDTVFDETGSAHEAQAASGDSGGAAFAWSGSQWQLAGILFAVGAPYSNQPAGTSLYGNLTFAADLSFYREEILEVMAMPEPRWGVWAGVAAVVVLRPRRRRGGARRSFTRSARLAAITSAFAVALASASSAVIIASGNGNTSAPTPGDCSPPTLCTDPGWSNVGTIWGLTGVYLGGRFVLTANHVGAANIVLGGLTYQYVPGTAVQLDNGDGTFADLLMFQIYPEPPLPTLTIPSDPPGTGTQVIMIGHGVDRGPSTSCGVPPNGYQWGPEQHMRWGTNSVAGLDPPEPSGTASIVTTFDQAGSPHEAQGAVGDSGGATFARNGSDWELAGILWAIGTNHPCQPQPLNTAYYGNFTFSVDLSFYRDQILDVMALPEPSSGLWAGAAFTACLARRRQSGARSTTRR